MTRQLGPWRLGEPLGAGGMGEVYLATHVDTGTEAAVKTVVAADPARLAALRREIHGLAALRHPDIVRILDHGVTAGVPWFAMERLEGPTLTSWRRRDVAASFVHEEAPSEARTLEAPAARAPVAPLSPERRSEALTLVARLCRPLAYLHGEGRVHGDLKPANVLVREGLRPVLLDFGLLASFATRGREVLDAGPRGGTPSYMSPEQVRGALLDARSDLYALGCLLYELLAGRPPLTTTWAHLHAEPDLGPIPGDLAELVARLLAKDPARRVGYAVDVARSLERLGAARWPDRAPSPRTYLYRPQMVGRGPALAALAERLPTGGLVLVSGESGSGKTRLVAELATLAARMGFDVVGAECSEGAATPLQAFLPLLQHTLDRSRDASADALAALLGDDGPVLARFDPAFHALAPGGRWPDPAERDPRVTARRLHGALVRMARWLGRSGLLLVVDDAQWVDSASQRVLALLREDTGGALVVATWRTEEGSDALRTLAEDEAVTALALDPLPAGAVRELVADMLALPGAGDLADRIGAHAEGNPLYVAEYLRAAVQEQLLTRDAEGRWQVRAPGEAVEGLPLPNTLRELIERRLLGLGSDAERVLESLAALGRSGAAEVLQAATGLDDEALFSALGVLGGRLLVEATDEVRFSHDKLREVAYARIDAERLPELHGRVAGALVAHVGDAPEHAGDLGRHHALAGDPERAKACFLRARDHADRRWANAEAVDYARRYLALVDAPTADSVALRLRNVHVLWRLRGAEAAEEEAALAVAEAAALGDRHQQAEALRLRAAAVGEAARVDQAVAWVREGIEVLGRDDTSVQAAELWCALGMHLCAWGRIEEGLPHLRRGVEVLREADPGKASNALAALGDAHWRLGEIDTALALLEEAVEIARRHDLPVKLCVALANSANLHYERGDLDEACARLRDAADIARRVGLTSMETRCLGNLGEMEIDRGHLAEAGPLLERAIDLARLAGFPRIEGAYRAGAARLIRLSGGDLARAADHLAKAEALLSAARNTAQHMIAVLQRGHLRLARGEDASTALAEALALGREASTTPETPNYFGRSLLGLQRAQAAFRAGEPLFRGEVPDDVPAVIRASAPPPPRPR